jgi:hypothetical protein
MEHLLGWFDTTQLIKRAMEIYHLPGHPTRRPTRDTFRGSTQRIPYKVQLRRRATSKTYNEALRHAFQSGPWTLTTSQDARKEHTKKRCYVAASPERTTGLIIREHFIYWPEDSQDRTADKEALRNHDSRTLYLRPIIPRGPQYTSSTTNRTTGQAKRTIRHCLDHDAAGSKGSTTSVAKDETTSSLRLLARNSAGECEAMNLIFSLGVLPKDGRSFRSLVAG